MHPQSRTLPVPQSEEDVTLLGEVAAQGWQLVVREGLSQQISYAYTVGLYRNFDHPEVIVSGQSVEKLKEMLQRICQRVEAGDLLVELAEVGGIFEKYYDVVFRTVLKKNYPRCFDRAIWFYQGTQFPAMQCVWPNYQHLYPFDAHYDNRGVKGQLKLYASGDPNRPYVKVRLVRTLRTLLGSLPLGAILKESEELSTVLNCLDWLKIGRAHV